jgi:UDP-N-acetylmuramyl pentapeptide phosphotransferase/UDP-N-acetylglucosamine-1-phosphate transferase
VSNATIALIVFVVTLTASVAFVKKAMDVFARLGFVDKPGARHERTQGIPRGLGVAIFLAFLVGIGASYVLDVTRQSRETERLLLMVIGSAIIVGVMLVDDAISLGPFTKLAWQIVASAIIVLPRLRGADHGIVIEQFNSPFGGEITLPVLLAVAVTFIWLIGMMNAMNWVDGLDGLAGSVTLVACVVLFIHTFFGLRGLPQFTISLLPLALGAAIIGFLPFNWHPAKVIMGDAGAMFLGFALAIIAIIGGAKIATALLALGLPILDGIWVVLFRLIHGSVPLYADQGHIHHRLLAGGWGQQRIVLFVAGVSALVGAFALLIPSRELKLVAFLLLGVILLLQISWLAWKSRRGPHNVTATGHEAGR